MKFSFDLIWIDHQVIEWNEIEKNEWNNYLDFFLLSLHKIDTNKNNSTMAINSPSNVRRIFTPVAGWAVYSAVIQPNAMLRL